jgi:hypothetical protein
MATRVVYNVRLNAAGNSLSKTRAITFDPTEEATHETLLTCRRRGLPILFPQLQLRCRTKVKSFKDQDHIDYGLQDVAEAQTYTLELDLSENLIQEMDPFSEYLLWNSDDVVAEMFHQSDKQTFGLDRSSESERTMQLQFQSAEREDTSLRYDYLPDRPESQTATEGNICESYIQNELIACLHDKCTLQVEYGS